MTDTQSTKAVPIARAIRYFGKAAFVACDARCDKAWGINSRPKIKISPADDDHAFLADGELGEAPADPGTYEGGHAKPRTPGERLNKWCVRECERCTFVPDRPEDGTHELRDLSRRLYNIPSSDQAYLGSLSSPAREAGGGR